MSSALSAFNWRTGERSIFADAKHQGTNAIPASNHPLRNAEAQKVRSTSRAPTANINTQKAKP